MSNYLFLILAIVAEAAGTKKHRKGGTIPPFHKKKHRLSIIFTLKGGIIPPFKQILLYLGYEAPKSRKYPCRMAVNAAP